MANINNNEKYPIVQPSIDDFVIGTDYDDNLKTKNFKLADIITLNNDNNISQFTNIYSSTPSKFGEWVNEDTTKNDVYQVKFDVKKYITDNILDDSTFTFNIPINVLGIINTDIKIILETSLSIRFNQKQYVIGGNTSLGLLLYDELNNLITSTIIDAGVQNGSIKTSDSVYLIIKYVKN